MYSVTHTHTHTYIYIYIKVICPKAGLSLDMHYQGSEYLSYQTKGRSEVVCQVLSSLSQWPYGNTFHCTLRYKSAAR